MITSEQVEAIFRNCLFKDGEDTCKAVLVQGVLTNVGFHPKRLEENRREIVELLQELPEPFMESSGGGWSFLNACMDRGGCQWTGLHQMVDKLLTLGLAIGKVQFCLPRDFWAILPGGMPYFVVKGE